jgi:hypothetical protein
MIAKKAVTRFMDVFSLPEPVRASPIRCFYNLLEESYDRTASFNRPRS